MGGWNAASNRCRRELVGVRQFGGLDMINTIKIGSITNLFNGVDYAEKEKTVQQETSTFLVS